MSGLQRRWVKLKKELAGKGLRETLRHRVLPRLGALVYARKDEILIGRELAGPIRFKELADVEVEVIEARHVDELVAFARRTGSASPPDKMGDMLRLGFRGTLARRGGEIIGHAWWVDGTVPRELAHPALERFRLALAPDETFFFDLFVAEDQRGRHTANEFWGKTLVELVRMGYRYAYAGVAADGLPARVLHRTMGFKDIRAPEARLYLGVLLSVEGRLFLKNGPRRKPHNYDFRPLGRRQPPLPVP